MKMTKDSSLKVEGQQRLRILAVWTIAWTISQAAVTIGGKLVWPDQAWLQILTLLLNIGLGIGMILSNRNLIMQGDELERKIQLESMALALGLSVVMGLAYSSLDHLNLIGSQAEIAHLVIFTALSYVAILYTNRRRYL